MIRSSLILSMDNAVVGHLPIHRYNLGWPEHVGVFKHVPEHIKKEEKELPSVDTVNAKNLNREYQQ